MGGDLRVPKCVRPTRLPQFLKEYFLDLTWEMSKAWEPDSGHLSCLAHHLLPSSGMGPREGWSSTSQNPPPACLPTPPVLPQDLPSNVAALHGHLGCAVPSQAFLPPVPRSALLLRH